MDYTRFFLFTLLGFGCRGIQQSARIYSSAGCNNQLPYADVTQDNADLNSNGFDNTIESAHIYGVWVFYEDYNYQAPNKLRELTWGYNYCRNFESQFLNQFSSMRHVGLMNDINSDTFTLFEGDWFSGASFISELDQSLLTSFNDRAVSVIVTGTSTWTFYEDGNYGGKSFCLPPINGTDSGQVTLGYKVDLNDNSFAGAISSARKGCFKND